MAVLGVAYPDPTQFDPESEYFDAKSRREKPAWLTVDMGFKKRFAQPVGLKALRHQAELKGLRILRPGNRLSVTP